uniref:Uncharacterized protein n=1 Tax=uncultured prokaryote TaxID=198431 RepID=A0A0H5Q3W7_9ZZZZ|nr:hypothetical protein [uncultured prokaryote]
MNVSMTIYRAGDLHKLTVVARPNLAAQLGEFVLVEGVVLPDLDRDPSALEVLSAAYRCVASLVNAPSSEGLDTV